MTKTHVLVAVVLSALTACGGDESDEGGDTSPEPTVQPDHRKNVTGSYPVTGTMTLVINGESDVAQVQDTLSIANSRVSSSKAALLLHIASLGCGPRAWMTGERTFDASETTCPLPAPQQGCTASLKYTQGSGQRDAGGTLQTSLAGKISVECGGPAVVGDVSLELSGSRTGQALPDAHGGALKNTAPVSLHSALERLALTARQ